MIVILLLLLLFICTVLTSDNAHLVQPIAFYRSSTEWWEAIDNPGVFLRKINLDLRKVHTCYEYREFKGSVQIKTRTFCYPAVIITGYKKCSTSALYMLLSQYPGTVKEGTGGKENCQFHFPTAYRSLTQFLDSFPETVGVNELIINGCIIMEDNMRTRAILRQPNTFYLVSDEVLLFFQSHFYIIVIDCFLSRTVLSA